VAVDVRVLFIGGSGRSGSTLIERMLGGVPGVCAIGEFRAFWKRGMLGLELCGCGAPVRDCDFWNAVLRSAFGGFDSAQARRHAENEDFLVTNRRGLSLRFPSRLKPELRSAFAAFADQRLRLLRAVAEVSGASLIVDSSKVPRYGLAIAAIKGLDVRALDLVRDSRAVAYSWRTVKESPRADGTITAMPRYTPVVTATRWITRAVQMEGGWAFTGRRMRLHYEAFVMEPAAHTRRILRFAEHPAKELPPRGQAGGSFVLGVNHTVLGNPMRFDQGEVAIRRDDRWRTQMDPADRRLVTCRTRPLLLRYGYIGPFKPAWARADGGSPR
jgi:Sulfotransferase family